MANILAAQSAEMRAKGEALIQQADKLLCESWNERMWSDGEPIDPSPTIDQAANGGFPWLEIQCARCKTPSHVDLAAMIASADHRCARPRHPPALPQMRQSRPTSRGDLAAIGLAAAPSPNRSLSDVQFVLDHVRSTRPISSIVASLITAIRARSPSPYDRQALL
jgi:hypothetical protein